MLLIESFLISPVPQKLECNLSSQKSSVLLLSTIKHTNLLHNFVIPRLKKRGPDIAKLDNRLEC